MNTPSKPYQPKTGTPCHCKRGAQRDNCRSCEGTGYSIDFAAIRARVPQYESVKLDITPEEINKIINQ